ncbi:sulfite exporter TauE/SafE family protein [Sandarakinorhabdus rubra]|uniref:sulfite exporter TauE/SafE family protein n=1 Tax=Sandarakinorhabdus rubra TaxID=2672568 RepID=UPI0013DA00EF|nr:sulfite exporter TauE/SafE family protein [Sandarakinorhabdus rubra]
MPAELLSHGWWFWSAALIGVTILGLAKGGFAGLGVLGVPVMALGMSPVTAAAILLPILLVQDVFSVKAFGAHRNEGLLKLMVPGACLGIFAGWALARFVPVAAVELAVGLISLSFGIQRIRAERRGVPGRANEGLGGQVSGVAMGAAAGFTSQIAHAGGPPFQMHVLPMKLPRDVFIGTSSLFFAIINWLKVPAYWALGTFTPANLWTAAALMPAAIASTWAGTVLVRRVDGPRFYAIMHLLMILVGAKLTWDGFSGL